MALAAAVPAGAQVPAVSGTFVSTLGNDTVAIERYTRTGNKLEGNILRRFPQVGVVHYVADLSDGKFKGLSVAVRAVDADPATPPTLSIVTIFADSVATIEGQRNGRPDTVLTRRRTFAGRGVPSIPGLPVSLGLYEQILATNPPAGRDTMTLAVLGSGRGPNGSLSIVRRARDTVAFVGSLGPNWIEVASIDAIGRILSVDATSTTVKTVTRRAGPIDFDATARAWAATEAARGRAGAMSPPDTVRSTIGAANIEIVYGRPFKRGRDVWGTVVEWNKPWRTGANAATTLSTSADLMFGRTLVPAGKYTLFSLPTPTGTRLIISSQTGQWGTAYDATRDFARLDMSYAPLTSPVEQFTMAVVPQGTGGVLKFSWDKREYSIPFTVR
jgi:hypothetical protein